jgi:hypothetical protein
LATSGQLDAMMGGSLLRTAPFENLSVSGMARNPQLYQSSRRSVYLPVLRSALFEFFQAFDFPDPAVLNGDRATTTVASQALFMMNGQIALQASRRLAEVLFYDSTRTETDRLQEAARRILARPAAAGEIAEWKLFLTRYQSAPSLAGERAESRARLASQGLCRALLSSNEFVYVD